MHRFFIISAVLFLLIGGTAMANAENTPFFEMQPIFAPDASRPANHASSIASMPDGSLLATWFGGASEGLPDVNLWAARKPANTAAWDAPYILAENTDYALGNSVLFVDSKDTVWLFYVIKYGAGWADWGTCHVFVQTSTDSGRTWSGPRQITKEKGYVIRANALEMPDGKIMLPVYIELPGQPMQSVIWISGHGFETYEEYLVPLTEPENLQPCIAPLGGDEYIMFARHHTVPGKVWVSLSSDGGKTWKVPFKHKLNNPDSGIALITLDSGALVFAWNDSKFVRTPLKVALSDDGGKTWPFEKTLETTSEEFSYPFLAQAPDGTIHLTYTSNNRSTIKHAAFNETWLRSQD
jgi:predicted neuraminidase